MARVSQADMLRLGPDVAAVKAKMSPKAWRKFVKRTHERGYTVRGALQNRPDALTERTTSSLRDEAQRTIADAYKPAEKSLDTREAAIGYLDQKRQADDASYRQWLAGEQEKLQAQASAADALLATQQQAIQKENGDAAKAARADSLKRMQDTGSVSDPNQSSTMTDFDAADQRSRSHIEAARQQTAALSKIGSDSRAMARASLLSQFGARETTRQADTTKSRADVLAERSKLLSDRAAAAADLTNKLIDRNVQVAQSNREADLAAGSLGLKEKDLAAEIKENNRKYSLERDKFDLDAWVAKNKDEAERMKVQLGYDRIEAQDGRAAADRALKKKIEKERLKQRKQEAKDRRQEKTDKKRGVTTEERDLYRDINSARGLITRWHKNGAVPPDQIRQRLRSDYGFDDTLIDVANDLWHRNGKLSANGKAKARRLGIKHVGYFWG